MFARLKRTAFVQVLVVAAYFLYALAAVPLVEPKLTHGKLRGAGGASPLPRGRDLSHLFPPGSWELERPKVIETDQGTLLFDDYKPLPDGRLELTRCTVVCYINQGHKSGPGQKTGDNEEDVRVSRPERRPVILRALQGATLTFDQNLDVLRGKIGRLIGGRLSGEISITSPASEPGRNDDLEIVTRNVQLDVQRIWTPHEVRFRYGPNSGQGRDLTIHLSRPAKSTAGEPGLGVGSLQFLELVHLDRLQLFLNGNGLFGRDKPKDGQATTTSSVAAEGPGTDDEEQDELGAPVEVTCRGPMRLDFQQQLITLEKQVDLLRHNPNGLSDQLLCELLEIHFTGGPSTSSAVSAEKSVSSSASSTAESSAESSASTDTEQLEPDAGATEAPRRSKHKLVPTKVIACGYPVIIRAASVGIGTRAERVEYDCIQRRVWLKDADKVLFNDRERELEAREVRYAMLDNGRLGDLDAFGPGIVRGILGQKGETWQVAWNGEVLMRRVEGAPLLSFNSQVQVLLSQTGTFVADMLHLYLREVPREESPDKVRIELDRLHAVGNVAVETAQLQGHVREARFWFRQPPAATAGDGAAPPGSHPPASPFTGIPGLPGQDPTGQDTPATANQPPQKFELTAEILEALVVLHKRPVADRLILRGQIAVREITPGQAQPVVIRGDLFELQDGASEHPRGALLGQPAEVLARGLQAHGDRFHIYPGDNKLQIVGNGDMTLPARRPKDASTTSAESQPARIRWQKLMEFDGQTARFEGNVSVNLAEHSEQGETRCVALGEVLRAQLTRRVDFRNPQLEGPAELAEINFEGWGFLEVESFEVNGERKAADQMQVRQLTVNQISGEIRGLGPGWIRGIHRGGDLMAGEEGQAPLPFASGSSTGLSFIRVDFQRTLAGNLHQRQIEFLDGTRTLYGPVTSWEEALDQIPINELPADSAILTSDRLAVTQPGGGAAGKNSLELEATGNAYVEGRTFSASGGRISYARAKDQLVLEGDGRNKATLAFQRQVNSAPSSVSAGKILFWPSTRQVQIFDFQQSEIYDVGQLRGIRPPTR